MTAFCPDPHIYPRGKVQRGKERLHSPKICRAPDYCCLRGDRLANKSGVTVERDNSCSGPPCDFVTSRASDHFRRLSARKNDVDHQSAPSDAGEDARNDAWTLSTSTCRSYMHNVFSRVPWAVNLTWKVLLQAIVAGSMSSSVDDHSNERDTTSTVCQQSFPFPCTWRLQPTCGAHTARTWDRWRAALVLLVLLLPRAHTSI